MKKTLLFLAGFALSLNLFAQFELPITHGDFEAGWDNSVPGYFSSSSTQPDMFFVNFTGSNHLRTLNILKEVSPLSSGPGPLTAFRETSDVHDGDFSMKLVTDTFFFSPNILTIPGAIGTVTIDVVNTRGEIEDAFFCLDRRPAYLKGAYKYKPINYNPAQVTAAHAKGYKAKEKDFAKIEIVFKDNVGNIVGQNAIVISEETLGDYVEFSLPIEYTGNTNNINKITLICAASGDYDFTDLFNCKGNVGSTLYLDNLELDYTVGLTESLTKSLNVQIFPNPTTDQITFDLEQELQGDLIIYDVLGREVLNLKINGNRIVADMQHLESGNYLYRIIQDCAILKSGKITKK